jgi:hypothetical protein
MISHDVAISPGKTAGATSRTEKSATGGIAGVEIVGFPQILHTRTSGDPDSLFVPLLDAAREGCAMIERLTSQGENRANAVMLTGMHLATSLLKDQNFSLVARGTTHETSYRVDFAAGILHANTRLYAVVSRRTSFFKVEIAGNISGGPFVVRNPVQGIVIMQVEEEKLRQPNFFSSWLAQECLRAQMEQERFGRIDETLSSETNGELRLVLTVAGAKVPITLRQKDEGGAWDIIDGKRREWVGTLSADVQEHLKCVTTSIQRLFEHG